MEKLDLKKRNPRSQNQREKVREELKEKKRLVAQKKVKNAKENHKTRAEIRRV